MKFMPEMKQKKVETYSKVWELKNSMLSLCVANPPVAMVVIE